MLFFQIDGEDFDCYVFDVFDCELEVDWLIDTVIGFVGLGESQFLLLFHHTDFRDCEVFVEVGDGGLFAFG